MQQKPSANPFDPEILLTQIHKFRKVDLRRTTLVEVIEIFSFINLISSVYANIGLPLYRVRKIGAGAEHDQLRDLWAPDPKAIHIPMGRSNDEGEAVFYAALDPITAIRESRLEVGAEFSLALYHCAPNEDGNLSSHNMMIPTALNHFSEHHKLSSMILSDFMFNEFTRQVSNETRFQYKSTCAISNLLFQNPNKDSIIYPSMLDYSRRNIVFKLEAAERRLTLLQVLHCKLDGWADNNNPIISIEREGTPDNHEIHYKAFHKDAKQVELSAEKMYREKDPTRTLIDALKVYEA